MENYYNLQLKRLRTDAGLSQQKLADDLGYTRRQIQSWESGERELPVVAAPQICEYFAISFDELAGLEEIDSDERRLVAMFRRLTPEQRATVLSMVEGLVR